MNGYPIVMQGSSVRALVIGGGSVASRKVASLLRSGASVHLVAPRLSPELSHTAAEGKFKWTDAEYSESLIGDANFIFAATDSREVNDRVASDARRMGRLVNVSDEGARGDFFTPAVHRDGPLIIAVFASGVPAAAARIRDFFARSLDARVPLAVTRLASIRSSRLSQGGSPTWNDASSELIGDDFLSSIETGEFDRRVERWR